MKRLIFFLSSFIIAFSVEGQDLMNKNYEGFRLKMSEAIIDGDTLYHEKLDSFVTYTGNDKNLDLGSNTITAASAKLTTGAFDGSILSGDADGNMSHKTVNQVIGKNLMTINTIPKWTGSYFENSLIREINGRTCIGNISNPYSLLHVKGTNAKVSIQGENAPGGTQGVQLLYGDALLAGYIGSVTKSGGGGAVVILPAENSVTQNEAARFNSTGNTLLGTSTDNNTDKLQVNGSGRFNTNLTVNGLAGTGTRIATVGANGTLKIPTATENSIILSEITKGIESSKVSGCLFSQTANKTIANTTTETSLIGTGVGSVIIPANVLKAGKTVRIKMSGFLSGANNTAATVKIKLGGVELVASTGNLPTAMANVGLDLEFTFTCKTTGATGTVTGGGKSIVMAGQAFATSYVRGLTMLSDATVNTTVANTLDVTYQWGAANVGNTITNTTCTIEILN